MSIHYVYPLCLSIVSISSTEYHQSGPAEVVGYTVCTGSPTTHTVRVTLGGSGYEVLISGRDGDSLWYRILIGWDHVAAEAEHPGCLEVGTVVDAHTRLGRLTHTR
jgi:hypothetical protein